MAIRRNRRPLSGAALSAGKARHDGDAQTAAEPWHGLSFANVMSVDGSQQVTMAGELDIATADEAFAYIREVIDHGRSQVRVDLAGLTFCDACGLGVLARAANYARGAGRQLVLTSARPSLLKIMRITGMDRAFPEARSLGARAC